MRKGFLQIAANTFGGMGFPAEVPVTYEFAASLFVEGSDLKPISQNIGKIVDALTKWQPKIKEKGLVEPEMVSVEGKDYQDAVDKVNYLFGTNGWSDGLPIVPPTKERVSWILTGTELASDTVIARSVPPRGGVATVESIAVALAMAGGRPEYLPVLIAAVDATNDPVFGFGVLNGGASSSVPAIIVNGPVAKQIRMGTGYGLLGPDPEHPGGKTIGRALRIIQQDIGGATLGIGSFAMYGQMGATNVVLAEDEEGLPEGWKSLAEERGFKREQNVVTVASVSSAVNVPWYIGSPATNDRALMTLARNMAAPNLNAWAGVTETVTSDVNRSAGVALIPRAGVGAFASTSGYTKADVKSFLWNNSKLRWDDIVLLGFDSTLESMGVTVEEGQDLALTVKPEQITIVVAGGDRSNNGYWMTAGEGNHMMVSREIKLPAKWDDLLQQNITDLGRLPSNR